MFRRRVVLALSIGLLGAGLVPVASQVVAAATDQLPDLRMVQLTTIEEDTRTIPGHRLLRYTADITNVGEGPFEVRGSRPNLSTPHTDAVQRVYTDGGTYRDIPVPDTFMFFAGDGHNHWHLNDLESGVLTRLSNGRERGSLAKHGFHFSDMGPHDLTLPNASTSRVYNYCDGDSCDPGALDVYMGLSVGWFDSYPASIAFQYIDITGLKGKFLLTVTADPSNWFAETDGSNNGTWAKLQIKKNAIKILEYGPGA